MQSFENKPTSSRKGPGASLNVDTSYKSKPRGPSPPRTPNISKTRVAKGNTTGSGRALRVRTGTRETFLDDITPIDRSRNNSNAPDRLRIDRDSHDLSLSPRQITRDSLVDHMLLSFDKLSFGQEKGAFGSVVPTQEESQLYNAFGDEEPFPTYTNAHNTRTLGHGHSYSSDYDIHDTNRPSSQMTRGGRSNSSSTFQAGLGRLNSIRNEPNGSSSGIVSRPPQSHTRILHSRSGKSSKGSSAGSLDLGYAQTSGTQRWTHGMGGRSSSFDFGHDRQMQNRQIQTANPGYTSYDYEAAPTPTVPVGPRRSPFASSPPPLETMQAPPIPKTIDRKRSTTSAKSAYKSQNSGPNGLGINLKQEAGGKREELPSLPAFVKDPGPAPAPAVGYGKAKDPAPPAAPPKDRPGFFRRVFGSSKNIQAAAAEEISVRGSTSSVETHDRTGSKPQNMSSQVKPQHAPVREAPPPSKEQPHVIAKKPSSFFRRRKKSISEPDAPPPLPHHLSVAPPLPQTRNDREGLTLAPLDSPVSSLRQVMNPYLERTLKNAVESRERAVGRFDDTAVLDNDDFRSFSPDYHPDPNTTIRSIKQMRQESDERHGPKENIGPSKNFLDIDSARSRGPNGSSFETRNHPDGTFLQDSSDNDRDATSDLSSSYTLSREVSENKIAGPIQPASVARDIALVAEYERTHSKRPANAAAAAMSVSRDSLTSAVNSESSKAKATLSSKDEEWVVVTPTKMVADKEDRVFLAPTSSEEDLIPAADLKLPLEGARASARTSGSTNTVYKSATSLIAEDVKDNEEEKPNDAPALLTVAEAIKALDEFTVSTPEVIEPTDGDKERAKKIYDGNEDFIQKVKAAAWLGEEGDVRQRTLEAYMNLYDFANLNILTALRMLCSKLILKAESQQVDRILVGFAKRWCQCNTNHGFKSGDVVHTICYSLLLLNTDLHMADIESKMTRSQFVKNTIPTILRVVTDLAPDAFDSTRPSILPAKSDEKGLLSPVFKAGEEQTSKDAPATTDKSSWRSSLMPPLPRTNSDDRSSTPLTYSTSHDDCGPLVKVPFHGTLRTWEVQVEIVLKDFYNSIRSERLPLFGAPSETTLPQQPSTNSLSVFTSGMLRRTPSVLSKASENMSNTRGRTADTVRLGTGKWTTKNRSRGRLYPSSGLGSSRTSLDDQSSMWSPSVHSSTWSKYSKGQTQTSMSVDSLGSNYPQGDYQQSIGFANALSQAIIREEAVGHRASAGSDELRVAPLLEDESLELAGAPWAKEGLLKHKHHLEAVGKKAKDRGWNETFAVIEKGYMSLFSFSSKSTHGKSKNKTVGRGTVVGGGNWQDNAESLGQFPLRQTIASALPPPGYSKARPNVWALSLPNGAVHLFQVGTPEIVKEFVTTANYWSARLSNHPLVGGISNIEYGWSDNIVNNSLVQAINDPTSPSTSAPRQSMQSSIRRPSMDAANNNIRSRLPGDRVMISDWTPPTQSMRASNLMEQDQLNTLIAYVRGIEEELQKHNQLRSSMLLAFTPRHPNGQKAMANWEKKSSYLLREIVKFRTYIDCLQAAEAQKKRIYVEREADRAVREGEEEEEEGDSTLRPE